ncbi:hypothetical protein MXL46_15285, partial [Heyndrickxia sporothermodurans]|uniref:hypothetical protein n=1 Tax=Heyndrickxia sporothermodurans TaxID=46224 RepID=UPI002DBC1487
VPIYWNSFTYYENKVRVRVEKYFFDTLPTGQTVDVSTFIEGGEDNVNWTKGKRNIYKRGMA